MRVRDPAHRSFIGSTKTKTITAEGVQTVYPKGYAREPEVGPQLDFALTYDGFNLEILGAAFEAMKRLGRAGELTRYVQARATGGNARRLWYLYEWLTQERLDLPDVRSGNYVPLLSADEYFTTRDRPSKRQRVNVNLLGPRDFCPVVRRTEALTIENTLALAQEARRLVATFDEDVFHRAVHYLFTKETVTSFNIEGEQPDQARIERFVRVLRRVPSIRRVEKRMLVELQNEIVRTEAIDHDYRTDQVYIGQNVNLLRQRIHFIAAKPDDVPDLMAGWLSCLEMMAESSVDPIVQAAVAAFGFVFIHPFQDGNGRLHRLLIHLILSRTEFTPRDMILPVSAVMINERRAYDDCLESFSEPVMELLEYEESDDGTVTVKGETRTLYASFDATSIVEYLRQVLEQTIRDELPKELRFLLRFRAARTAVDALVDLPDRLANLFVRLCRQNNGRLSGAKRNLFQMLSDEQIASLEKAVRSSFEESDES